MDQQHQIIRLQLEIKALKEQLQYKEEKLEQLQYQNKHKIAYSDKFTTDEISRYSRQMLVPSIGIDGQDALKNSQVLIVGIGGLGCPAALYLVAAGVGQITIVDNDDVDLTNLHRQILYSEFDIGVSKVNTAFCKLNKINSNCKLLPLHVQINGQALSKLLETNSFNVVIDGTDNVVTRYLLNDLCVINKIPLVSGSALQMEGQLTVYNYIGGPCYRCLYPVPPPPETVSSCGDSGVLGVVPGVIGVLQALECIKIITEMPGVLSGRLLLFDACETIFRNIKLRNKVSNCAVCGDNPTILFPIDYEQFCGSKANDKVENINILDYTENIDVLEFLNVLKKGLVLDVRPIIEYEMCHLPKSVNIPYTDIVNNKDLENLKEKIGNYSTVFVMCRRGNDSQRAILHLKKLFEGLIRFVNIKGGFHSYSTLVDSSFPIY